MKITDTISVNPSKTALGHVESPSSSILRSQVIGVSDSSRPVDFQKLLFPGITASCLEFRKYEVGLRTIFSTILIVSGLLLIQTSASLALAICSLCFGAFLAIGLFTRPLMLGAAIYYCIAGALSIRFGHPDISIFSLMFGCLIFAVVGSGKYSCDTLIKRAFSNHKNSTRKCDTNECLGYKAFHKVRF